MSIVLFISLLVLFTFQPIPPSNPAPYVYYFSDSLNAIVIERADGTDSRVIGKGLMSPETVWINGPGWSPSGRYFAWTSAKSSEGGPAPMTPWVFDVNTAQHISLVNQSSDWSKVWIETIEWSPNADLLFLETSTWSTPEETSLFLFDISQKEVVASIKLDYPNRDVFGELRWSKDGQEAFWIAQIPTPEKITAFRLTANGTVEEWPVDDVPKSTQWSVDYGNNILTVNDPANDSKQSVTINTTQPIVKVAVSQDKQNFLVYAGRNCSSDCLPLELWLVSLVTGEIKHLANDAIYPRYTESWAEIWREPYKKWDDTYHWSPDNQTAAYLTKNGTLNLYNVETQLTEVINISHQVSDWNWSKDGKSLFIGTSRDAPAYLYDLANSTVEELPKIQGDLTTLAISSPNGRYFNLSSTNAPTFFDVEALDVKTFASHSGAVGLLTHVLWHEDSEWFITGENAIWAGGGGSYSAYAVSNVEGSIRREFGKCVATPACIGWLPERVVQHLSTGSSHSVVLEPVITLALSQSGSLSSLKGTAWSPDGKQLGVLKGDGTMAIYDVVQNKLQLNRTLSTQVSCDAFPFACPVTWNADGSSLITSNGSSLRYGHKVWDAVTGTLLKTEERQIDGQESVSQPSPNGQYAAQLTSNTLTIVDQNTDEVLWTSQLYENFWFINAIWLGNDRLLINGREVLLLWNAKTNEAIRYTSPRRLNLYTVAISPDEKYVVGASVFELMHVWQLEDGALVRVLNRYALDAKFSPDGRWLATIGWRDTLTLWATSSFSAEQP